MTHHGVHRRDVTARPAHQPVPADPAPRRHLVPTWSGVAAPLHEEHRAGPAQHEVHVPGEIDNNIDIFCGILNI